MPVTTNTRKLAALLGASGGGIATDGTLTSTAIGEVIVAGDIAAGAVGESEMASSLIAVKPHIQPGTLYPAWSGLLEDNTGFTFTDSSASAHTITPVGDIHHSGANKKGIGSTSMRFNSAYLSMDDSADWHMAGEEFTIEYWFRLDSTTNYMHFGQNSNGGIVRGLIESLKLQMYFYGAGGTVSIRSTTSPAP